jgi:hypothetical protein
MSKIESIIEFECTNEKPSDCDWTLRKKDVSEIAEAQSSPADKYHRKETCNNCGSLNEIKWVDGEDGIMHEGETKCTCCGFSDYWAHGFFASMQDGYDKCEKYQGYR